MAKSTKHREGKASVKAIYYPSKTFADGSHPFMLRITKDRKRKYIFTGITLHPQFWNHEKGTFRKNIPSDKREFIEAALRKWENRYEKAAEELAEADEQHDAIAVATKISQERNVLRQFKLLSFFDNLINQFEGTGNIGNRKVYRDVRNNLQHFIGKGKDVPFDAVTFKFCSEWETAMRTAGLTDITLSVKFRTLRAVLNKAIANGYVKATNYPFARNTAEIHKFQIGKFNTKTAKRAISKADIHKIETFEPTPYNGLYASLKDNTKRQMLAKNMFLFSYYCGGINFIDMASLKLSNVTTDIYGQKRLTYTRQKNGGKFSIRLLSAAWEIIESYKFKDINPFSEYIFPILSDSIHKTPTQRHNRCNKIMGQVNADLKIIGAMVGIEAKLTTYVARHSFATSLRMAGQDVSVISQAMGHANEATTRIYLQELGTELIDSAFDDL